MGGFSLWAALWQFAQSGITSSVWLYRAPLDMRLRWCISITLLIFLSASRNNNTCFQKNCSASRSRLGSRFALDNTCVFSHPLSSRKWSDEAGRFPTEFIVDRKYMDHAHSPGFLIRDQQPAASYASLNFECCRNAKESHLPTVWVFPNGIRGIITNAERCGVSSPDQAAVAIKNPSWETR